MSSKQKPNPFANIRALQEAGQEEQTQEIPNSENAKARNRTNALTQAAAYRSSGIKVREDIHQAYKILAAQTKTSLYLLMEEDLLAALERRKAEGQPITL